MPAYNHEKFVGEATDSVLNQTFGDLELIVIDDGSTDRTAEIVKSYDDARVKYHYQHNQDAFNAINNGMAMATGRFVCIINSDDAYEPGRLERMLETHRLRGAPTLFRIVKLLFALDADTRQDADRVVLDLLEHRAKHFERLALVLLFRVLLRI